MVVFCDKVWLVGNQEGFYDGVLGRSLVDVELEGFMIVFYDKVLELVIRTVL